MSNIGEVIKTRREALSLMQSEVAKYVGVTTQTYSKWENNKTEPKASQVAILSEILKLPEREICNGQVSKKSANPIDFITAVAKLSMHIHETVFLITLWQHIDNEEEFIASLKDATDVPSEFILNETKE